jgi:hypothetical protein
VRAHCSTEKTRHTPIIGDIDLTGDAFDLTGDGLVSIVDTPKPGSAAAEQLAFLASWATQHIAPTPDTAAQHHD